MSVAVLHILGTAQPEGTGIARIVSALAAGLDPKNYRIHAWFLGPPGPLMEDLQRAGAEVRSVEWSRGARDPVGAYRFLSYLRKHDYAIVHQHFGARSVRRLIRLSSNARIVVHLHGMTGNPASDPNTPSLQKDADLVIAASAAIARQYAQLKPKLLYAGVDTSLALPAKRATSGAPVIIGTACRLEPGKGLIDLLGAMALLRTEFPPVRLEIAGTGSAREILEREAARRGLAERVRFLGWQRDTVTLFRRWSIFAMPSHDEGFGMAALEAMATSLPIVATRVGGLPELVADGQTGYLVAPSDPTALAGRLRDLILDPDRRQSMGAAGRERARTRFSVTRLSSEATALYDCVLRRAVPR